MEIKNIKDLVEKTKTTIKENDLYGEKFYRFLLKIMMRFIQISYENLSGGKIYCEKFNIEKMKLKALDSFGPNSFQFGYKKKSFYAQNFDLFFLLLKIFYCESSKLLKDSVEKNKRNSNNFSKLLESQINELNNIYGNYQKKRFPPPKVT